MATEPDDPWAPWYYYVVPILVLNLLKQQALQDRAVVLNVAATLALIAAVVAVVTWLWRGRHRAR